MKKRIASKNITARTRFWVGGKFVPIDQVRARPDWRWGRINGNIELKIDNAVLIDPHGSVEVRYVWEWGVAMLQELSSNGRGSWNIDEPGRTIEVAQHDYKTVMVSLINGFEPGTVLIEKLADKVCFIDAIARAAKECLEKCLELDPRRSHYLVNPIEVLRSIIHANRIKSTGS